METTVDCMQWLDTDVTVNIFLSFSDSADVVHAGAVSHLWRQFMIENGISKQVCERKFPQLSSIARILERGCRPSESSVGSSSSEFETLKTEHKVYASLLKAIETILASPPSEFIDHAIGASSTDNFPLESISNTLYPRDSYVRRASYWSSKGQRNPDVPETLIYKLKADFGVVTEFRIQPFEAFFQPGNPIYSAKSVRFRVGHPKSSTEILSLELPTQLPVDDKFVWTYTSQDFPMSQENCLQVFKLPEPILCIGGFLQIELMGRVQTQEVDELFYICVSHVKAIGRPLSPGFEVQILEQSGKFSMTCNHEAFECMLQSMADGEEEEASRVFNQAEGRVGLLGYLLGIGIEPDVPDVPDEMYPWGYADAETDDDDENMAI
ncbi:unnamed protein product [Cuscuta campestris]|uniref:F-box domain-containing protein n=1 Tax=Cuscuta campestris TaxID=132261 RepID=A0A484LGY8_9ASTE|nr:unnamed protein product [Cuscuta campestris]